MSHIGIEWLAVFLGGGVGSCLRYAFSLWWYTLDGNFPFGTLSANVISCLILGFVAFLFQEKYLSDDWLKTLLLVGFCGGFSTFSSFTNEVLQLLKQDYLFHGILYMMLSLILGNLALLLGGWIAKYFIF